MRNRTRLVTACLSLYALLHGAGVNATDVALRPVNAGGLIKPNVIFGWDNSTSMNWETLLNTKQGMLWWDPARRAAWDAAGVPLPYTSGAIGYGVLFPIAGGVGANIYPLDATYGAALPPTKQFAAMWSSAYNSLYYNPNTTYSPWPPANLDGVPNTRTVYGNENPAAARAHPGWAGTVTRNLTVEQPPWSNSTGYNMQPGMVVPAGATDTNGTVYTSEVTLTQARKVLIPFYWATYWRVAPCVVSVGNPACAYAPGSTTSTLQRVQIAPGTPEMQNFANWWSYYRSRSLMGAAATGRALEHLSGVRLGVVRFNPNGTATMYDTDSSDDAANARRVAGLVYSSVLSTGTRTLDTLDFIGDQFRSNTGVIQYACQRNNAFIVTDGFADRSPTRTPPAYDASAFGTGWPYQTTHASSMANVALSYFTSRSGGIQTMRPDLSVGRVPLGDQTRQNPDSNRNLHMNTYAVTLGVRGRIWPATSNAFGASFSWPVPAIDTQDTIDDLWHATINGRGLMYETNNAEETAARLVEVLEEMTQAAGGQSAIAVSSSDLAAGDGRLYRATYNAKGWSGDVVAHSIDGPTGTISTGTLWSAAARLAARNWTTRVMATSDGSTGRAFNAASVGVSTDRVDYLRGNRSGEGTAYRKREALLGAVLNARPLVANGIVYASTGEGMLHAFDAASGDELWAYAPFSALAGMRSSVSRTWAFKSLLDGSPTLAKVGATDLLIAGRGVAGRGYAALDVTDARAVASDAALASRVRWEFPSAQGVTTAGLAVGKPVVVPTRNDGDVVLLTQGYNGSNDGIGRVYMLDALTGALRHTFLANSGSGSGDPGLAHISAMRDRDGMVAYAYGGDEQGNLWKFDLNNRTVTRIARLLDASGTPQPVTTAPELVFVSGQRVVLVGTGRLLGVADFGSTRVQSFYAIKDTGVELPNARAGLTARTLSAETGGQRDLSGAAFDWATQRGWYFDLPAGQQANTDPAIVYGAVVFSTNAMAPATCTGSSYAYVVDVRTGLNVVASQDTFASVYLGATTSSGLVPTVHGGRVYAPHQESGGGVRNPELQLELRVPARKSAWRPIHRP